MTEEYTKADPVAWKHALFEFKAARVDLRALKDDADLNETTAILIRYNDAERALLALAAPDIDSVIEKLMIFFEHEIRSESEEGIQMCRTIGDLRRIEILNDL